MSGYGQRMFGDREVGEAYVEPTPSDDSEWVPYTPPPPVPVPEGAGSTVRVSEVDSGSSSSGGSSFLDFLFGTGPKKNNDGVVGTLVDIFGRLVHPNGQVITTPPPKPPTPMWVYLAIPVALIGVVALIRRKPAGAVAGYRRRSRRSKR